MSNNYNEITAAGTSWIRPNRMFIENPVEGDQKKYIRFFEEQVINFDNKLVKQPLGYFDVDYNPQEEIPLRDPVTGDPLPVKTTHLYLYQILYSLYRNKAEARDQQ